MFMAAKFGKMMASLEGLVPIMLLNTSLCSRGLARSPDKLKTYFHYHNACGHKTWHDGGLPWTPSTHVICPSTLDHIITWSYEITWQTKIIMYSRSRGPATPSEKLDLLYLFYYKAYDHQTWKEVGLLIEASNYKVIKPFKFKMYIHYRNVSGNLW